MSHPIVGLAGFFEPVHWWNRSSSGSGIVGQMVDLAVQYLEDSPDIARLTASEARDRLRKAFDRLPITKVLVGWNLPPDVLDSCWAETTIRGCSLFRWHPFLTGDGKLIPRSEWQTSGLTGQPILGFKGLPEFTFICPNKPAVQEAVLARLEEVIRDAPYQGVFLDRIRFPSPAADPVNLLACFCEDCQRVARQEGLDLDEVKSSIHELISTPIGPRVLIQHLLAWQSPSAPAVIKPILAFLDFRERSISRIVRSAVDLLHSYNLQAGLDCFSPTLTCLVGQDLGSISSNCDWTKIMSYGHTLGPAGIPFELLALADWLDQYPTGTKQDQFAWLSAVTGLGLPSQREKLRMKGLPPEALVVEVRRARAARIGKLLAGIELVDLPGVTNLSVPQITADLNALHSANIDGLALSWDLLHIPLERLDLVRKAWDL